MRRLYPIALFCVCLVVSLIVVGAIMLNEPESDGPPAGDDLTPTPTEEPETTPTPTEEPEPTTTPSVTQLESGMIVIYYARSTGSSSTYDSTAGTIVTSAGGVFRWIPEKNESEIIIDTYVSQSYAPNNLIPYTIDGRLFLIKDWRGEASFSEEAIGETPSNLRAYIDYHGNGYPIGTRYAIVGNRLYYITSSGDELWGIPGGELYVCDLTPRDSAADNPIRLLKRDSQHNYGRLLSTGENLYRYELDYERKVLIINRIDLTNGKILHSCEIEVESMWDDFWDFGSSTYRQCVADREAFYISARMKDKDEDGDASVNLWRISWTDIDEMNHFPLSAFEELEALEELGLFEDSKLVFSQDNLWSGSMIDADEGYVLLMLRFAGEKESNYLIYDCNTGKTAIYPNLGSIFDLQILKVR